MAKDTLDLRIVLSGDRAKMLRDYLTSIMELEVRVSLVDTATSILLKQAMRVDIHPFTKLGQASKQR